MKEKMDFSQYLGSLPPFIARKEVQKVLGGIVSPKTLANADSLGIGPKSRKRFGKTVVYETAELLRWLTDRNY